LSNANTSQAFVVLFIPLEKRHKDIVMLLKHFFDAVKTIKIALKANKKASPNTDHTFYEQPINQGN
jgi:hypothetical protein